MSEKPTVSVQCSGEEELFLLLDIVEQNLEEMGCVVVNGTAEARAYVYLLHMQTAPLLAKVTIKQAEAQIREHVAGGIPVLVICPRDVAFNVKGSKRAQLKVVRYGFPDKGLTSFEKPLKKWASKLTNGSA